ncbi:MAG: hypothetical protein KF833_08495 [Verrucomicrobiae bacterium]|nr:hypothetical protein [Verrucomicrobiae bacterium]
MGFKASDYRNSYLNSADLRRHLDEAQADVLTVTVASVSEVRLEKLKLVLHWHEDVRALVLNRGNLNALSDAFGDDTDGWIGQRVNLWIEATEMNGVATEGIRLEAVETPPPAAAAKPSSKPAPSRVSEKRRLYSDAAPPETHQEGVPTRRGVRMPPPSPPTSRRTATPPPTSDDD